MNTAYLSLGSNEGNRLLWLQKAIQLLNRGSGTISKKSAVYETAAWGITDQPSFLNMAVALQTTLNPAELLAAILDIETQLGRQRTIKWGPRTLDIDILLFNNNIIRTSSLTVPHPYLHERRFTLLPLADIAPDYIHPIFNKSVSDLLVKCPDNLDVHKYAENSN